jgi:hypothetical protein
VADPRKFVGKSRVLPVTTNTGVRTDFLFAAFPFEQEMVERAPLRQLGGVTVRPELGALLREHRSSE